jgi:hypothetical protein
MRIFRKLKEIKPPKVPLPSAVRAARDETPQFETKVVTIEEGVRKSFDERLTNLINSCYSVEVLAHNLKTGPLCIYIMTLKTITKINPKPQPPKGRVMKESEKYARQSKGILGGGACVGGI